MNRTMLRLLLASVLLVVLAHGTWAQSPAPQPPAPQTALDSAFTYQGSLARDGRPVNGTCDFTFDLFDAPSGGNRVGTTQSATAPMIDGMFTVNLNFGSVFTGGARWLAVAVRCAEETFTALTPRQPLTPAPYALGLAPGANIDGASTTPVLTITNSSGTGVASRANSSVQPAVSGENMGDGPGVAGRTNSPVQPAISGENTGGGTGVAGRTNSPVQPAVAGENTGGGTGVAGRTNSPVQPAISGENMGDGPGVRGKSNGGDAGYFEGNVHVTGDITRAYTAGTANLAVPIAYGVVGFGGILVSGTPNVSSAWDAANSWYQITIVGESYSTTGYVTIVTPIIFPGFGDPVRLGMTYSNNGNLLVQLRDSSGAAAQGSFQFITYKP